MLPQTIWCLLRLSATCFTQVSASSSLPSIGSTQYNNPENYQSVENHFISSSFKKDSESSSKLALEKYFPDQLAKRPSAAELLSAIDDDEEFEEINAELSSVTTHSDSDSPHELELFHLPKKFHHRLSPRKKKLLTEQSLKNMLQTNLISSCLTPEEEAETPIKIVSDTIAISHNAVLVNSMLLVTANVVVGSKEPVRDNQYHLSIDAGRLGSIGGFNLESDLCYGLRKLQSNATCPVEPGLHKSIVLVKHYIPRVPGLGTWIRSISIKFSLFEMTNGVYTPGRAKRFACIQGTLPIVVA